MGELNLDRVVNYKKIKDIDYLISEKQYIQISKICEYYDTNTIKNRLTNIREFILNEVDEHWLGRLRIITNKLKTDVISDYACKIRYGDNWEKKQFELKEKVRMDKHNFIKKYGEKEGLIKWVERNKKTVSYGLKPAIMRYGEIEGKKKWEQTLKRKVESMAESKKIRPYRNGRTLTEYQQRYGVDLGYKKWDERNKRQSYRNSELWYIDTYGEVNGKIKWEEYCSSMNLTTLQSFVKRYGEVNGAERYETFIKRMKFTSSVEYFIEKYGDVEGKIKYNELILKKISQFKDKYSKISQDLFWNIYQELDTNDICYFYELNNEYTFYVWENNIKIINVDFKMGNKIIEFDGDYWHSKPEQIKIDIMRDDFLKKKGYIVKRVKESEYRNNKKMVIDECMEFLKND